MQRCLRARQAISLAAQPRQTKTESWQQWRPDGLKVPLSGSQGCISEAVKPAFKAVPVRTAEALLAMDAVSAFGVWTTCDELFQGLLQRPEVGFKTLFVPSMPTITPQVSISVRSRDHSQESVGLPSRPSRRGGFGRKTPCQSDRPLDPAASPNRQKLPFSMTPMRCCCIGNVSQVGFKEFILQLVIGSSRIVTCQSGDLYDGIKNRVDLPVFSGNWSICHAER